MEQGVSLFEELLALASEVWPATHALRGRMKGHYGACLAKLARYEESEAHLLASYNVLESSLGAQHAHTVEIAALLVELYESLGASDKAAAWRARSVCLP